MGIIRDLAERFQRPPRKIYNSYQKYSFQRKYGEGIDVISKDWDNLIILDACRYDMFKEYNTLGGELESVISKGSHSLDFCNNNFKGKRIHDTIYITTNPFGAVIGEDVFFKTVTSFEGEITIHPEEPKVDKTVSEEGDELRRTHFRNVDPENLKELAISEHKKHPDKRLIIHFMQPHMPYIGEKAEKLRQSLREKHGITFETWNNNPESAKESMSSLKSAARRGYITDEELRNVYIENLSTVLDHVEDLLEEIDGKTVITADHGELLGEKYIRKKYGHEPTLFVEELRKVPWLTIPSENRRNVNEENPVSRKSIEDQHVDKQLELLGYK